MKCTETWNGSEVAQTLALVTARRQYYREMLTLLPTAAAVLAEDRWITFATPEFCRIFGMRNEDYLNRTIDEILPAGPLNDKIRAARLAGISPFPFQLEIKEQLHRISVTPLPNWRNSSQLDILLLVENLSEIRQAREAARTPDAVRAIPHDVSDTEVPAILWQADSNTLVFQTVRGAAEQLLGYPVDHWLNNPQFFSDRIHPEDRAATLDLYRAAIARGRDASAEYRCLCGSGVVWVRETIRVFGPSITGVITPIGALKRFEEQKIQAARWVALRGLASQSAQDLHNASLAMEAASPIGVDEILPEVERISHITGELLNFTLQQPNPPGVVNIPRAIEQLKDKIAVTAGKRVSINLKSSEAILGFAEESRLDEVILALVSSISRDALEHSRLTITCDVENITEQIPGATLTPGTYARLMVRHEGRGLDLELQGPLFESFSISTNSRQSTRLALSRAYAVVRHWGGDISFSSEPDRAAEFLLYLPHCPQFEIDPQEPFGDPASDTGDATFALATAVENDIDTLLKEIASLDGDADDEESNRALPLDSNFVEGPLP